MEEKKYKDVLKGIIEIIRKALKVDEKGNSFGLGKGTLLLTALMMVGCEYRTDAEIEEAKRLNGFNIVVIDSCEYLKMDETSGYQGYGFFAHKGNCRFCKERRQKEIKELVEQLKK